MSPMEKNEQQPAATGHKSKRRRGVVAGALVSVVALTGGLLVACGSDDSSSVEAAELPGDPSVFKTDLEAFEGLVKAADGVVVSDGQEQTQRRAAAISVATGAPMLSLESEGQGMPMDQIAAQLNRVDAKSILVVGNVNASELSGDERAVYVDPGTDEGLNTLLDIDFQEVSDEQYPTQAVAEMDPKSPTLVAGASITPAAQPTNDGEAEEVFPQSTPKNQDDSVALVSPESSLASIATARSAGVETLWMEAGDPRATESSREAAVEGKKMVALGTGFGDTEKFRKAAELASNDQVEELPGGGTILFPGRRIVATYGHPGTPALGLMGEQDPAGAVAQAQDYARQYEEAIGSTVIPGFEIIASVAQADPGPRGDYSEPAPAEVLEPYIDAMTDAGGYVILDLQPGNADFLDQAKLYEDLLKRPNVGLALDSEWKIQPGEKPLQRVGNVEIEEVNRVVEWLADLTAENNLPQKMLMLHQFQLQMIRDRDQLDVSRPELAIVLHADGHGTPDLKFQTWNVLLDGLQPEVFEAWKNFIDEDNPTFTPQETMDINPRPWVVTYQ